MLGVYGCIATRGPLLGPSRGPREGSDDLWKSWSSARGRTSSSRWRRMLWKLPSTWHQLDFEPSYPIKKSMPCMPWVCRFSWTPNTWELAMQGRVNGICKQRIVTGNCPRWKRWGPQMRMVSRSLKAFLSVHFIITLESIFHKWTPLYPKPMLQQASLLIGHVSWQSKIPIMEKHRKIIYLMHDSPVRLNIPGRFLSIPL